ncbi:cysteine desulfurase family protein [Candidatus Kryptobacter tengchongensis]|uniref:cysteine desulfurase n=1 Tax=Kryptobacter tengchongensis TaxID=1643429 RepID=A0A916LJY7_KRYT1|nr:cysteine desulfurase family protein [Candidatus Kryptobacter tengchongensis]CUT02223.1 cysteine desulfurase [Candidatus Kryptobacter tengchongensis]
MRRVYLDNSATTPVDPAVVEAMMPYFTEIFGNPSSVHWFGREAKVAIEEARYKIANFINADPSEIIFTSGGTESDNFAIFGVALSGLRKGKKHIITTKIEHHAVLDSCLYLQKNGFEVTFLKVGSDGVVDPDDVRKAITSKTCLISVMHVNNEIGTIQPIQEIGMIAMEHGIPFHTDAVQSFGKIEVDVKDLKVDLISASAHKIYGPKGIGFLYVRNGVEIEKFHHGGSQEAGRRAGTESVPLIVGFAKAVELCAERMKQDYEHVSSLRKRMIEKINDLFAEFGDILILNSPYDKTIPYILNFSINSGKIDIDAEALIYGLDLKGVAVSNGSACTSGSLKPSHVILALGRDEKTSLATVRFSFGRWNTIDDVDYAVEKFAEVVKNFVGRAVLKT